MMPELEKMARPNQMITVFVLGLGFLGTQGKISEDEAGQLLKDFLEVLKKNADQHSGAS
jgi:uncharacterized protein YgfB (UPF0149 family)